MNEELSLRDAVVDLASGPGQTRGPLVLGLCGGQGSGKSTLAAAVADDLARRGIPAATLSLDDLYLTLAERTRLYQVFVDARKRFEASAV